MVRHGRRAVESRRAQDVPSEPRFEAQPQRARLQRMRVNVGDAAARLGLQAGDVDVVDVADARVGQVQRLDADRPPPRQREGVMGQFEKKSSN